MSQKGGLTDNWQYQSGSWTNSYQKETVMDHPNNLRVLRDKHKLTQAQVAEHLGINQAEYSRIEKGRRRIGTHLTELMRLLNCQEDDILRPSKYEHPVETDRDMPVYALSEPDGESVRFDMAMASRTERPPFLKEAPKAFSIFNCGNRMMPRLNHGDLLYCDPDQPLVDDDLAVIVLSKGNRQVAIVRQYLGADVFTTIKDSEEEELLENVVMRAPVIGIKLARAL